MKFTDPNPEIQQLIQENLGVGSSAEIENVLIQCPAYFRGILDLVGKDDVSKAAKLMNITEGKLLASLIHGGLSLRQGANIIIILGLLKERGK